MHSYHRLLCLLLVSLGFACEPTAPAPAAVVEAPPEEIPLTTPSEKAKELFIKGRANVYSRNEALAIKQLKEALQEDEDFALAHLYLARAYDNINDSEEAAISRGKAEAKAASPERKISPGEQYLIQAYLSSKINEAASQLGALNTLVGVYPSDVYAHYELGRYYDFQARRLKKAKDTYEKVIELNEKFPAVYNSIAYVYADLSQYDDALGSISKYAELLPDNPNAFDSKGEISLWAGKYDEAIAAYDKALEKDPDFYYSYLGKGHAHAFKGDTEKAREMYKYFQKGALSDSDKLQADHWIAISYVHEGKLDEARKNLQALVPVGDAIEGSSWGGSLRLDIAWIEFYLGRSTDAKEATLSASRWLSKGSIPALTQSALNRQVLLLEGLIAAQEGNIDSSQATLGKLKAASSERRDARALEFVYMLESAIAIAQKDFEQARALLPKIGSDNYYSFDLSLQVYAAQKNGAAVENEIERIKSFNRNALGYALLLYRIKQMPKIPAKEEEPKSP